MKKLSVVFLFLSLIVAQPRFVTAKNMLTRQNNRHLRRGTVRIGKYFNNIHRVIARLGASPKILIIDKDIALEADMNIPDNITVKIMKNGSITLGDYDLIIHKIKAGPHPCFICNGSGKVTLGTGTTGIYPQWFGAKGDGLADDTLALQNTLLLSSDTGIPIIITEGSMFKTTDRLYCYGKCTMKGSGENCVISLDETIADHWINIGISTFSIEGDWATGSFEKVHFQINNSSFAGDALFLHRVNDFSLKNCTFTLNNSCSGIKAGNNPVFTLNPYHNNIEITGCRMIASQGADGGKGIDLSHSTTVTITDNYIFGVGDDPIALHDCKDFIIKNNSCFSVTGRIASYNSIHGSIANNYITRVQNLNGDYEAGTALIYLGTDTFEDNSLYTSNNIEITNNNLICPSNSIDAGYILSCSGGREITIDNNTIENNSPYTSGAICLTPTYYTGTWTDPDRIDADNTARSKDITISNNIIHGTELTGMGIHVQGTSAENISVKISNNLASRYNVPGSVLLEQNNEFNDLNIDQLPASFENLDSLEAKWFGSSFDDTTLQKAITVIGSDHWTLNISRGTWTIDKDLTFNKNTRLRFEQGTIFNIDDATVAINGSLDAGLYQIFDVNVNSTLTLGDGAVEFMHPAWTGAIGSGLDELDELTAAETIAYNSGVPLWIPSGITICFNGMLGTRVSIYSDSGTLQTLNSNTSVPGVISDVWHYKQRDQVTTNELTFKGLKINGNSSTRGFFISGDRIKIKNCEIYNCEIAGIGAYSSDNSTFENNYIHNIEYDPKSSGADGIYVNACNYTNIINNQIADFQRIGIVSEGTKNNNSSNTEIFHNEIWNAHDSNLKSGASNAGIWFENTNGGKASGNSIWDIAGNSNQSNQKPRGITLGAGSTKHCTFIFDNNSIDMYAGPDLGPDECRPISLVGDSAYPSVIVTNTKIKNTFRRGIVIGRGLKNITIQNVYFDNYRDNKSTASLIFINVAEGYGNPHSIIIDNISYNNLTLISDANLYFSHLCIYALDSTNDNIDQLIVSNVHDFCIQNRESTNLINELHINDSSIKCGCSTIYSALKANEIYLNNTVISNLEGTCNDSSLFCFSDSSPPIFIAENCVFKGIGPIQPKRNMLFFDSFPGFQINKFSYYPGYDEIFYLNDCRIENYNKDYVFVYNDYYNISTFGMYIKGSFFNHVSDNIFFRKFTNNPGTLIIEGDTYIKFI